MGDSALIAPDKTVDFLKVKVFLYKYTPEMTPAGDSYTPGKSAGSQTAQANQDILNSQLKYSNDLYKKLQSILNTIQGELPYIKTDTYKNVSSRRNVLVKPLSIFLELPTISKSNSEDILYLDNDGKARVDLLPASRLSYGTGAKKVIHLLEPTLHANIKDVLIKLNINRPWYDADADYVFDTLSATVRAIVYALGKIKGLDNNRIKQQTIYNQQALQADNLAQTTKQFKINRFTYELSPKYLSRFDISRFVHSYNSSQSLEAGTIGWDINLSNEIVPFAWLEGDEYLHDSVRRPILFPDDKGNYSFAVDERYDPVTQKTYNLGIYSNVDPITKEQISTFSADGLTRYIAMYQSLEDINRKKKGKPTSGEFYDDVDRIEFAMRIRGIRDEEKKKNIISYFETGVPSTYLLEKNPGVFNTSATFDLKGATTRQKLFFLSKATDPTEDGLQLGDLISRYDFISVFVYKWRVPPRDVEELILSKDINFFDKESLFQYTPYNLIASDDQLAPPVGPPTETEALSGQYFPLYQPEFNGFVKTKTYTEAAGRVNAISLRGEGVLSLFSASRRIYNTTIWQGSIFEAAEAVGADTFTIFQNLFQDKNPMEILEILLEGVYKLKLRGIGGTVSATDYATKYLPQTLEGDQAYRNGRSVHDFLVRLRGEIKVLGGATVTQGQKDQLSALVTELFTLSGLKESDVISKTKPAASGFAGVTDLGTTTTEKRWELLLLDFPAIGKADITHLMSETTRTDIKTFQTLLKPNYESPFKADIQNKADILGKWVDAAIKTSERFLSSYQNEILSQKKVEASSEAGKQSRTYESLLSGQYFLDGGGQPTSVLDISEMRLFNRYGETNEKGQPKGSRLLFNIPMFLYANVMRMRKFNVRVPKTVISGASNDQNFKVNNTIITRLPKETDGSGGSILEINPYFTTGKFSPYFLFLSNSLGNYIPDMKTPFEIVNDVKATSYLEFFETPGGRLVFRTPQWNNTIPLQLDATSSDTLRDDLKADTPIQINTTEAILPDSSDMKSRTQANMFTSYDIDLISTTYEESAQGFITKQHMAYGVDIIGQPIEQLYYHYTNGKILAQYGLITDKMQINPNVRAITLKKTSTGDFQEGSILAEGIYEYCRFFLEMHNMGRSVGVVRAVADPLIQVGYTFYDARNQKFGYINNVTKSLVVGGTYTCTFNMTAVRDTSPGTLKIEPEVRQLPYLKDICKKFGAISTDMDDKPRPLISTPAKGETFERTIITYIEQKNFPRKRDVLTGH